MEFEKEQAYLVTNFRNYQTWLGKRHRKLQLVALGSAVSKCDDALDSLCR